VSAHVRKRTVAVEWNGRSVEVGDVKGGVPLAVHLHVSLPLDSVTEFRQVLGTIDVARLRGDTTLDIVEGLAEAVQLYGKLSARTGGGRIEVKTFKGEELGIDTASGEVAIIDARCDRIAVRTASGSVSVDTVTAESLEVASQSGDVALTDVEPRKLDVRSGEGEVDIATRFKRTREASIVSGADVVLRVGEVTPFDLVASTRNGGIKTKGVGLEQVAMAENGPARWRRGSGGIDVRVLAEQGSVTVRAIR
jgi:DUF4097 and DUF4098 domain-containing protein YvlB